MNNRLFAVMLSGLVVVPVLWFLMTRAVVGTPYRETSATQPTRPMPAPAVTPVPAESLHLARQCEVLNPGGRCLVLGPSLLDLIVRPELYDGRTIRTIGFVHFEFEGNHLYVSQADWLHRIAANSVWIDPPPGFESDSGASRGRPNDRYVIVEGRFSASHRGHLGMSAGAIEKVSRLDPW